MYRKGVDCIYKSWEMSIDRLSNRALSEVLLAVFKTNSQIHQCHTIDDVIHHHPPAKACLRTTS